MSKKDKFGIVMQPWDEANLYFNDKLYLLTDVAANARVWLYQQKWKAEAAKKEWEKDLENPNLRKFNYQAQALNLTNKGIDYMPVLCHELIGPNNINYQEQPWRIDELVTLAGEVSHDLPTVKNFQIGNEYNMEWEKDLHPDTKWLMPPEIWANLVCRSYETIKKHTADARIVIGGLVGLEISYLEAMITYIKNYFGYLPSDIDIAFHWYLTDKKQAIRPSQETINLLAAGINSARQLMPNANVYLTEMGYSNGKSRFSSQSDSYEERTKIQGEWGAEFIDAGFEAGFDKVYWYCLTDLKVQDPEQEIGGNFRLNGLLTIGIEPKESWFIVKSYIQDQSDEDSKELTELKRGSYRLGDFIIKII